MNDTMNYDWYDCPVENLPYDYPDWNNQFFCPLCRPWYKDQESTPEHGIMTDLYTFAASTDENDNTVVGTTLCGPIF